MTEQPETLLGRIKEKSVQLPPKKNIDWDEHVIIDILQDFLAEYLAGDKEDHNLEVEYTLKIIGYFNGGLENQHELVEEDVK